MTPLSARVYLEAYYDLSDPKYDDLKICVEHLVHWQIVQVEALEATWPEGEWQVSFQASLIPTSPSRTD